MVTVLKNKVVMLSEMSILYFDTAFIILLFWKIYFIQLETLLS